MRIKRWEMREPQQELACTADFPRLVAAVLAARGVDTPEKAEQFLHGVALDSPFLLVDMDKAARRIATALQEGERIAVYGDFDCDGICATVLMVHYLQSVGADVIYYIPDRGSEGYGMNQGAVHSLKELQIDLIITVDNGISAHAEIALAAQLGMDVVVTDHHTPQETLPDAVAVVNPHRIDCSSRFRDLAGVGVAFKLICALEGEEAQEELLEYYSDLLALATIADLVPLLDENRTMVRHGLVQLAQSHRPGISALLEVAGIAAGQEALSAVQTGFLLVPRINAAGRLGQVDTAVQLLLTDDLVYAQELAQELCEYNEQRKQIEQDILLQVQQTLEQEPARLCQRVLIISGHNWHHGVIGIVAARLVDRYSRPCILFSIEDGVARGSGRSVDGVSLIEVIAACSERLTRYGGHSQAAGLTLLAEHLPAFEQAVQEYAAQQHPQMPLPKILFERQLAASDLTLEAVQSLAMLEPFGMDNPAPRFLLEDAAVLEVKATSGGKHLRVLLEKEGRQIPAIWFRCGEEGTAWIAGQRVSTVVVLEMNHYNGTQNISVQIQDMRPAGLDQEALFSGVRQYRLYQMEEWDEQCGQLAPAREQLALVYRTLRACGAQGSAPLELYFRLHASQIGFAQMMIALDVFVEMGLSVQQQGCYTLRENPPKIDLEQSALLQKLRNFA